MAKNSLDVYKAVGKGNLLQFDPSTLKLVTDEKHPLYDKRVHKPLNESLVLSIMVRGVISPIIVAKNPETGEVEVVAGRQRVKATIEANRRLVAEGREPRTVPGYPRRDDVADLAAVMVVENEQREADTPLGRAEKMRQLQGLGITEDRVAEIFGVKALTVRETLALLDCTQAVRDAVDAGKIGMTHVKALAKFDPKEQRAKVAELIKAGEGAKPHERAKAQRAVVDSQTPKVRGKKELTKARDAAVGDVRAVLDWVLGEADELPMAMGLRRVA